MDYMYSKYLPKSSIVVYDKIVVVSTSWSINVVSVVGGIDVEITILATINTVNMRAMKITPIALILQYTSLTQTTDLFNFHRLNHCAV